MPTGARRSSFPLGSVLVLGGVTVVLGSGLGLVLVALLIGATASGSSCGPTSAAGPVGGVPAQLIPIYQAAASRYALGPRGPSVLAAINRIESDFGQDLGTSSAGAVGWMQFEPASWAEYGVTPAGTKAPDGPRGWDDPADAIFSAANLLRAGGAPDNWQTAIFTYNHAQWYVDEVLASARRYSAAGATQSAAPAFAACAGVTPTGYTNPLAHIQNLTPERIDMGVDYSGAGTLVAIGDGQITAIHNSGWPNGTFIEEKLTAGPYAGKHWYYAEDITPSVHPGETVAVGQPIGQMFEGGSGIETGWSIGDGGTTLAASLGQIPGSGDAGGWSSAAGGSASRLLRALGAPAGVMQPGGPHGTMPVGYP